MGIPSTYTTDHLAKFNSSGQIEDSGKSLANIQELITAEITMTKHTRTISVGSDPSAWSIQALNSEYTPIMCGQLYYNYSLVTTVGIETFIADSGSLTLGGFAECTDGVTRNIQLTAEILWKKN